MTLNKKKYQKQNKLTLLIEGKYFSYLGFYKKEAGIATSQEEKMRVKNPKGVKVDFHLHN